MKRIIGDVLHHLNALRFQTSLCKSEQHGKQGAEHGRDDQHIDTNKFDPQLFQHWSATSK